MKLEKFDTALYSLKKDAIAYFLKKNDTDFYKKLSDRVDIDEYATKLSIFSKHFATLDNNGNLLGLSCCYFNNTESKIGYISFIAILKGYRRLGIGSKIITKIIQYGIDNNFKELEVKINCSNNVLMNFYKKQGFVINKQEKQIDMCLLKKSLN